MRNGPSRPKGDASGENPLCRNSRDCSPTLRALSEHFDVGAVLTNTDKPGARGRALVPSAVKSEALRLGLPVLQHDSLGLQARTEVAETGCDTLVCFAYGRMFGPKFLSLFPNEKLNIHPSLLPSLRGPSPIQGAILNQMKESGISIQRIAREMDSGDLLACEPFVLQGDETSESLSSFVSLKALIWQYGPLAWCRQALQRLSSRKERRPHDADHRRDGASRFPSKRKGTSRPHPRPLPVAESPYAVQRTDSFDYRGAWLCTGCRGSEGGRRCTGRYGGWKQRAKASRLQPVMGCSGSLHCSWKNARRWTGPPF